MEFGTINEIYIFLVNGRYYIINTVDKTRNLSIVVLDEGSDSKAD